MPVERMVIVDVDANGNNTVETAGFQGNGCKDVAKLFSTSGKVNKDENKPEYYSSPNNATVSVGN